MDEELEFFMKHGRLPDAQSGGDDELERFFASQPTSEVTPDQPQPDEGGGFLAGVVRVLGAPQRMVGRAFESTVTDNIPGTVRAIESFRDRFRQEPDAPRRIFAPGSFDQVAQEGLASNPASLTPTHRNQSALVTPTGEGIRDRSTQLEQLVGEGPDQDLPQPEVPEPSDDDPELAAFMAQQAQQAQQEFDDASHVERRLAVAEGEADPNMIPTPDAVQAFDQIKADAVEKFRSDSYPKRAIRATKAGVRDAPGILGWIGRIMDPDDSFYETLLDEGWLELGVGEQGFKLAGTFVPPVAEVLMTKGVARALALKLPGPAKQIADIVGRSAAGTRAGGALTGAVEGLPTDIAIALESGDITDAGAGIAIGTITGYLLPGMGQIAPELAEAIHKRPQQMTDALVDWVRLAEEAGNTELRSSLDIALARAYESGDEVTTRVLDDVLDRLPTAREAAERRLRESADPKVTPETRAAVRGETPDAEVVGVRDDFSAVRESTPIERRGDALPDAREAALARAEQGRPVDVQTETPLVARPRDAALQEEVRGIADRPAPTQNARRVTPEGQVGAPDDAAFIAGREGIGARVADAGPVAPTAGRSADDLRTLDPEDPNSERFRQLYNERNAPAPASRPRANDPEVEARPQTPEVAATPAVRVPDDVRPARENINEVVDASFMSGRVVGDEVARVDDLRGGIGSAANDHRRVEALVDEITGPDGYWERIIVDQDDNVVEGAHRLEAARLLGFDEVPVTRIADNTASIDETVAHAALKGRGLRSDQRNQLVGNVGEMVADAGSVRAAREAYDLPRGFEDHYNTVLDALEGTSARPAEAPVTPRLPDDVPPVRPVRASDVANDPDGAYVYHVTSEPNARSIMTDGFRQGQPTAGRGGSYPANSAGRTFFTDKQGVSEWVRRIEAHLFDQFDDPPPISVLRVRRDALESMSSLKDDPIQDVVGSRSMMANTDELEDLLDFDARFDLLEAPVTPRTPDPDPAPAPRTPRAAEGPAARLEETPDPPRTAREPVRPADLDKPEVRQRFDDAIHKPRTNDSVLGDLSEAGFIDPALLRTLAPSAAFGTAGAVVGSTLGARSAQKEEDVTERAVLGAALGAVVGLGPAGWRVLDHLRDDKGVGKTFRKYLTAGGPLPSAVKEMTTAKEMSRELLDATRDALSRRRGSGSLFDQITAQKVGDFADAVGRTYGGTGRARVRIGGDNPMDFVPEADKEAIRRLLTGDATARGELSEQVADAVDAWRHHIDANSVTLKKIGAAEGDLAATLDKHMGIYLNRSYRVFDVPDWEKNAPKLLGDAEWERRKNQFKSWYRDSMDEFDEDTVEAIMEDLIAAGPHGNPLRFIEDNSARLNKNIFKRRNDKLPLAIRELWGEYDDPFLQYTRTVAKQSQYIANFKFLGEMREVGEGSLFWFPRNAAGEVIDDAIKAQDKKIVNSGERVGKGMTAKLEKNMGPLAGARTTPEMAAAIKEHFEGVRQIDNGLGKALVWTLSWVKIAKTAFSQVTQIRNLTGNPMMLMEQGHFDFKLPLRVLRGSRTLLEGSGTVRSSGDAKLYYNELLRRNIINDTANATEIEEALKRVNGVPLSSWGSKNPLARQARRLVRAGKEIPLSLYRAGDDLFKIAMYELEQTRYLKALGHSDATKAPRELVEKMKDRSARATRNLMPTYSQTPEVINKIRRWGGFLSWPAERMRNIYYTFRQMEDDWKYGDGEFKGIAMQRAFGLAASLSMQGAGLTIASRKIFNITKEEENAVREFVLPWDENANLVFLDEIGEDGNFEVWNSTYTAPSSQFIRPVVAFMRGEDWRPTLAEVTQEIIAPYAQLNPALTEAVERLRASGDDEAFEFTMRMLDGMVESVTPGAIEQWTRANTGFSSSLYPLDRKKEYMALRTGQKSFTSKIEDDLLWDFRGLRGRLDSVTEKFDRAERAGRVNRFGTRSLEGLEENTTQRRRDVYMDVARKAHAALVLGKSEREIRALMQEADMSTENRELVWRLINQQRVRWER